MNKTQEEVSNIKGQVNTIFGELVRHSTTIDTLISEEGPIDNVYIKGHMEAHLERIEDSMADICNKYDISDNHLKQNKNASSNYMDLQIQTQRQGMKLLLNNIRRLDAKVRNLISKKPFKARATKAGPMDELSRKLKNDLRRTSYQIQ